MRALLNPPLPNRSGLPSQVAVLFAVPFKRRLKWNKLRCQAAVRLTAANKALAQAKAAGLSASSHSCISFSTPRTINIPLLTPWLSDCFLSVSG